MNNQKLKKEIGKRLKTEMKQRKLRLKDIANLPFVNVTPQNIDNIILGKTMLQESYAKIIGDFMNVDPDYLLCKEGHDFPTISAEYKKTQNDNNRIFESFVTYAYHLGYEVFSFIEDIPDDVINYFALYEDSEKNLHCPQYDKVPSSSGSEHHDTSMIFHVIHKKGMDIYTVISEDNLKFLISQFEYMARMQFDEPFSQYSAYLPHTSICRLK